MRGWVGLALWLAACGPACAQIVVREDVGADQYVVGADGSITVPDYDFRATMPAACKVQIGDSGGHVHGFGAVLDREGCGAAGSKSVMGIWADGNALDAIDALAWAGRGCDQPMWANDEWRGAIDGLRTVMCRKDHPGGGISIQAISGSGVLTIEGGRVAPRVFYRAYLETTPERLDADMKIFRAFVCSIDVTGNGVGSTLCKNQQS
jgi:hypothetical protein